MMYLQTADIYFESPMQESPQSINKANFKIHNYIGNKDFIKTRTEQHTHRTSLSLSLSTYTIVEDSKDREENSVHQHKKRQGRQVLKNVVKYLST